MALPSAVYRFKNFQSGTYLDNAADQKEKIQGWKLSGTKNQEWQLRRQNDYYILCNVATGRYVSASGAVGGTPVGTVDKEEQASHWDITNPEAETNTYRINLKGTEGVIDLAGGSTDNGTLVNIWSKPAPQQKWIFEILRSLPEVPNAKPPSSQPGGSSYQGAVPPGKYWIRNVQSGTALNLIGSNANDGASIFGFQVSQGPSQQWELEPGAKGYRIRNIATSTYLSLRTGEIPKDGVLLTGNRKLDSTTEWEVRGGDQNGYSLLVSGTSYVLDLDLGSAQDGAKIYLRTNNNGKNQRWTILNI